MAQIGLLGFGEVGQMLAADISRDFLAFDIQFDNPQSVPFCAARQAAQVQAASSTREFQPCPLIIISAVTAGQVVAAVESVLPFLEWAKNQPNGLEKENLGDLRDSLCKNLREANADH